MAEIVLTLKGGRDYDAPWLVVHAEDWNTLTNLFVNSPFANAFASAQHAIVEGNALADVKATLGAVETTTGGNDMPTPPVVAAVADPMSEPANKTLIAVAAKKSGKSKEELKGISKAEAQRLIQGGS